MTAITEYDQDVIKWSEEQANFLLTRQFDKLDLEHLADEVLDVGKSEVRELGSHLAQLLAHLVKWAYQPTHRGSSWEKSIRVHRRDVKKALLATPSLKSKFDDDFWERAWVQGLSIASTETGIHVNFLPADMPWTPEQVLTDDWLPETAI